ncbi:hypothetical protein ASPZODRAFT_132104 [Penicilliopsis zonata CBS 506.65]|uniref:Uncharacterized protein n=1 Tax=Penicilliopsis zonata CBS 506.65 TaxID=1073090 RepID=A0A1L9SIU9_9EURO|nr:hypothetical protein ASPZODRAFT_132104 [Penicilliopsis zonata CBS 506.65]OJJ47149.1 hypothetical protein ASPZODRAFT_132104 [Penicilliopsis zonata CBS 506.65]
MAKQGKGTCVKVGLGKNPAQADRNRGTEHQAQSEAMPMVSLLWELPSTSIAIIIITAIFHLIEKIMRFRYPQLTNVQAGLQRDAESRRGGNTT